MKGKITRARPKLFIIQNSKVVIGGWITGETSGPGDPPKNLPILTCQPSIAGEI